MDRKAFSTLLRMSSWALLAANVVLHASAAEKSKVISEEVDRSVVSTLSRQGVTKAKIISHIDLTEAFGTSSQWTFVAAQDDGHPAEDFENHGPIFLCLVKAASAGCEQRFYHQDKTDMPFFDRPYRLLAGSVVYSRSSKSNPLLLLQVCGASSANGNCNLATALYKYDEEADEFTRVFLNSTGHNNNEATRFVESGQLQGDVIDDYPTENAPYTYWVEVFRAGDSGKYGRILRYRGRTHYGDGNPLAVIDSEMPEILHRLGLWNEGDPLPVPPHLPQGCKVLSMRQGEEWCK